MLECPGMLKIRPLKKSSNGGLQQSLVVKNMKETVCENSDRPTRPSFPYPWVWDLTMKVNATSKDISSTPSEKSSKVTQKTRRSQRVRHEIDKENQLARLEEEQDRLEKRRMEKELEMETRRMEKELELEKRIIERKRRQVERDAYLKDILIEEDRKNSTPARVKSTPHKKNVPETVCMIDHHAATEEGVNAPAICQPLGNLPKFLHTNKIMRTDDDDEKKIDEPYEDLIEEQNPCIVRNPEEVYLSQEENILCHNEKLKNGAMVPLQSMEGASEVDKGFKMPVQGRFAEEKKNPHRRKIDFNRKKWKEDLPKLRLLWRGEDGIRPTGMRTWIYFEMSINVQRNIPWRTRRWTGDWRSDDAGAVMVRKYEENEDNCNSMIPCSDVMDKLVQIEDFSSDSELKIKIWFRSSSDVLKVEGSDKEPGLASLGLRAGKKIEEVKRVAVKNSPVVETFKVKTVRVQPLLEIWNLDVAQRMTEKRLSILEQIGCIRNVQAPGKCGPLIKSNEDVRLPVFCDEIKQPWSLPGNCRLTGRGDEVMVNIVIKFATAKQNHPMDSHFTSRRICFGIVRELKMQCGCGQVSKRRLLSIAACLRLKKNMPCPPDEDEDPEIVKVEEAITPIWTLMRSSSVERLPGRFRDSDLSLTKKRQPIQVLEDQFWRMNGRLQFPVVQIEDFEEPKNKWIQEVKNAVCQHEEGQVRLGDTLGGNLSRAVVKLLSEETDWFGDTTTEWCHWEGYVGGACLV